MLVHSEVPKTVFLNVPFMDRFSAESTIVNLCSKWFSINVIKHK
jgi:hypothetical protein